MLAKITPKNRLVQETEFPNFILVQILIVLHQKVFKPIFFHSTQNILSTFQIMLAHRIIKCHVNAKL